MSKFMIKRANAAVWAASLAVLALSLLMTVPGSIAAPQDKNAPEGLIDAATQVEATAEDLEGTWTNVHVKLKADGGWRHSGTFTITKFEGGDGLQVRFHGNGGGDDPKAENKVKFAGGTVTMDRSIAPPFVDPDTKAQENSQTWTGTVTQDDNGKWKMEGKISGAGMNWHIRHGDEAIFQATK
jgi:hypothetical protein